MMALHVLAPSKELLNIANESGNYNDSSYVILYRVKKKGGGSWKILFAGDSEDETWAHIIENYGDEVSDVDVLLAPHHGRDSGRDFTFLETVDPTVTLFGNASSKHLAYSKYPGPLNAIRITNNQAGYIIMNITEDAMSFYVKHYDFARDFRNHRGWTDPSYNTNLQAYFLFQLNV